VEKATFLWSAPNDT